jgi:hypothetical protein
MNNPNKQAVASKAAAIVATTALIAKAVETKSHLTARQYEWLERSYDRLNAACGLHLDRKVIFSLTERSAEGYFRIAAYNGDLDEIAIGKVAIKGGYTEILTALLHQMIHRAAGGSETYHNQIYIDHCVRLGLSLFGRDGSFVAKPCQNVSKTSLAQQNLLEGVFSELSDGFDLMDWAPRASRPRKAKSYLYTCSCHESKGFRTSIGDLDITCNRCGCRFTSERK